MGGACLYFLPLISSVEGFSWAFWELGRRRRNVKKVLEAGSARGLFGITEVNFTEPASLCEGGETWARPHRAWNPQLGSLDCLVQAPHFAVQATAMGTSCRQLEGQGLERSLLAGTRYSLWYATQLPKSHLLLSILPLCICSFIHSFILSTTVAQPPSQVLLQGSAPAVSTIRQVPAPWGFHTSHLQRVLVQLWNLQCLLNGGSSFLFL